jgi:hypothetical protein
MLRDLNKVFEDYLFDIEVLWTLEPKDLEQLYKDRLVVEVNDELTVDHQL